MPFFAPALLAQTLSAANAGTIIALCLLAGVVLVVAGVLIARAHAGTASARAEADAEHDRYLTALHENARVAAENRQLRQGLAQESTDRSYEVRHDLLTGLLNRGGSDPLIDDLLRRCGPTNPGALMIIGLNQFRDINTTLGPAFGDRVLPAVGERLRASLPDDAVISRLSGDEFGAFVPGIGGPEVARDLAEGVVRSLAAVMAVWPPGVELRAVAGPAAEAWIELSIDAAVGVALAPLHGSDRPAMFRRAYVAMASAKEQGTAVSIYDESQERWTARQLSLVADLRRAITRNELRLLYQPKADLRTGKITGAEALVRWEHPVHGLLAPSEFLPLAEHTGLLVDLNLAVLEEAVAQLGRWRALGHDISIAVNVTAGSLRHSEFPAQVAAALTRSHVPADRLTLEITEGELVDASVQGLGVPAALRRTGVRLSIDDFGTGYSSLAYLSRLPVDEVKVDRTFVVDLVDNKLHAGIVGAVIEMCRLRGGITVVAEGVEDRPTWLRLVELGCGVAQGFGLSRPLTGDALAAWLATRPVIAAPSEIDLRGSAAHDRR